MPILVGPQAIASVEPLLDGMCILPATLGPGQLHSHELAASEPLCDPSERDAHGSAIIKRTQAVDDHSPSIDLPRQPRCRPVLSRLHRSWRLEASDAWGLRNLGNR